jgi:predicted branched-subunit amino acid permease
MTPGGREMRAEMRVKCGRGRETAGGRRYPSRNENKSLCRADSGAGAFRVSFSAAGVRRGYVAAQPLAFGVFVYGVTFGLLASSAGLSIVEALVMSATIYSGSAQTAMVSGITTGVGIGASVLTILMLNARYLLYGAALRPWLGQAPAFEAYSSLYLLGDSNWVLSMKANASGEADAGFVFGSGLAMFLPWVGGTLLGAIATEWVADPKMLGLDFLLVAFCAAMGVGLVKSRHDLLPVVVAIVAAVVVDRLLAGGWTIVAAGLAAALTAFARAKEGA